MSPRAALPVALAAALAAALAVATPARAAEGGPTVDGLELTTGDTAYEVLLRGSGTLGPARVRSTPGLVRVWLSGFDDMARLVARGDGARIRRAEARPGIDTSLLVSIRLAAQAHVPEGAIAISRAEGLTRIALPNDALPPPPAQAAAPPQDSPAAPPARTPDVAENPSPETSPAAPPAGTPDAAENPSPETSPAVPPAGTPDAAESETPQPTRGRAGAPPRDDGTDATAAGAPPAARFPWEEAPADDADPGGDELALGTTETGATTGTLVLVSLFLGLVYVGVRVLQNRNATLPGADPAIALVATRRLGPKHQLVVVRAMGRDHLLSVQGSATKRLASTRSPDPDEFEASFGVPDSGIDLAPPSRPPAAPSNDVDDARDAGDGARQAIAGLRYPSWSTFTRRPASSQPLAQRGAGASRDDDEEIESRFGARLFDYALNAQRRADDARRPRIDDDDDGLESSEAVAGLLRLRARRRSSAG